MAAGTVVRNAGGGDGSVVTVVWNLTTGDPAGAEVSLSEFADKTWTSGNGAADALGGSTMSVQGRNASADTLVTLNKANAGGIAATLAVAGVIATIENPLFVAPVLTTVGAGAIITVRLIARRATPLRT